MPDLTSLKLKEEDITVDYDAYVDASEFPPPAQEGVYDMALGKAKFDATDDGYLVAVYEGGHKVVGGDLDGRTIATYDRISNKPFERQGVKVSMMADQLRALGITERPRSHGEFAALLEGKEGATFKGQIQWEGGCNHEGTEFACDWKDKTKVFRVKGARNFPPLGNGSQAHADTMPCPTCKQEVRARDRITRRIPA